MKSSLIDKVLLPHTAWALLLLIPITFLGFYPSYYSAFQAPVVIHIHGAMMALWLVMVILQPWLIKTHNIKWHRLTGRFSYVLVPCIVISGYFVLHHGFLRVLGGDVVASPDYYPADATPGTKAADFVIIGSVYLSWLLLYYLLGITFRKKTHAHATFMLAAALTILGPAGDRLIWHLCAALGWPFNALAGNFVYGLVFVVFLALLVFHRKRRLSIWPTLTVLTLHITGVFFYYHLPFHPVWDRVAAFVFYY